MEASASSSSSSRQIVIGNAFEGLAPQQHSSFPTHICDVFINHRGPDVKMTLASTIYHTLQTMNLRAFLDVEELELGDFLPNKIQDAMRTASLHIAIFSPRYAESPWCLAELSFMLKTDAKIIPVFYEVKPSDLRYIKKGMYSEAFAQHERKGRYGADKLDEWKAALYNVSFRTGFELNKPDGDQGKLLKSIVNSVLKAVKKAPLEVAKHPVGLSEMVEIFQKRMLERMQDNESVKIVGIVGMGGSGKTTLAKELYNQECHSFKGSSFVFNVREASANKALHTLQSKLLKDLVHIECPIYHVDEGKEILRNRLRFSRVLIILDDVDNVDQIDALLVKDVLGAGSVIVVTSRDKGVLQRSGISFFLELKGLKEKYARELFCWHSFLQPTPLNGFKDMVDGFLNACGGLPLSLKVVGGLLYGERNPVYWQDLLQKIKKTLPQDIMQILRISYDALDTEEKQIFLDIACFFIGENRSLAVRVWDGSEWSGFCSIQTLEQKCLVDVDEDDCLQLHDHLRDLGRNIAYGDILNSTLPIRLWHSNQTANTLQRWPGRVDVRGIMAVTRNSRLWQATSCYQPPFAEMLIKSFGCPSAIGLQLLVIKNNYFNSKFSELSSNLVWLRWYDFPETILPSWLSLKKLRVLELIGGKLEELWQCEEQAPSELRELNIWGSRFCKFPKSIGMLIHLEKVVLIGLELDGYNEQQDMFPKHHSGLESLPEEFCYLQSLKHLELRYCESLISLPNCLGYLTNLKHLSLFGCRSLRMLPDNFGRLTQLQFLDLTRCENLVIKSDNFGKISSIEHLSLWKCGTLLSLPNQITCQTYLTKSSDRSSASMAVRLSAPLSDSDMKEVYLQDRKDISIGQLCLSP